MAERTNIRRISLNMNRNITHSFLRHFPISFNVDFNLNRIKSTNSIDFIFYYKNSITFALTIKQKHKQSDQMKTNLYCC